MLQHGLGISAFAAADLQQPVFFLNIVFIDHLHHDGATYVA